MPAKSVKNVKADKAEVNNADKVAKSTKAKSTKPRAAKQSNPEKDNINNVGKMFYGMFLYHHSEIYSDLIAEKVDVKKLPDTEYFDDYLVARENSKKRTKKSDNEAKERKKPLKKLVTIGNDFKYRLYNLFDMIGCEMSNFIRKYDVDKSYIDNIKSRMQEVKTPSITYGSHLLKSREHIEAFNGINDEYSKCVAKMLDKYNINEYGAEITDLVGECIIYMYNYIAHSFAEANIISAKNKLTTAGLSTILSTINKSINSKFLSNGELVYMMTRELPEYLKSKRGVKKDAPADKPKKEVKIVEKVAKKEKEEEKKKDDSDEEEGNDTEDDAEDNDDNEDDDDDNNDDEYDDFPEDD